MKRCDFCGYCSHTERDEQVCIKRLLYVGNLDKDYPCSDFSVRFDIKESIVVFGVCVLALVALVLIIS